MPIARLKRDTRSCHPTRDADIIPCDCGQVRSGAKLWKCRKRHSLHHPPACPASSPARSKPSIRFAGPLPRRISCWGCVRHRVVTTTGKSLLLVINDAAGGRPDRCSHLPCQRQPTLRGTNWLCADLCQRQAIRCSNCLVVDANNVPLETLDGEGIEAKSLRLFNRNATASPPAADSGSRKAAAAAFSVSRPRSVRNRLQLLHPFLHLERVVIRSAVRDGLLPADNSAKAP